MIKQPQPSRQDDRQRRKADSARQSEQVIENWDRFREDEGDGREAEGAAEPGGPVREGIGLQVWGVAQDADEDVFGGDVQVEAGADDQADEADAVGYFLHCAAGALLQGQSKLAEGDTDGIGHTPSEGLATHLPHQR